MPMRIGNYGQWEGDRRGNRPGNYHPPACTCFSCNEGRRRRQRPSKPADTGTQRASRPPGAENQRTSKPNNSDQQSSRSPKARPERQRRSSSPRQPRDGSGQGGGGCACLLIILVMIVGIGIVVGLAIWGPQEPIFSSVKPATSADAAPAPTPVLTPTPLPSPEPTATPFLAVERERAAGYLRGFTQAVTELKATIVPAVTEFVSDPTLAPTVATAPVAVNTPTPTQAPAPSATPTKVPSPTVIPTATSLPTPTSAPTLTPTPTLAPTPNPVAHLRHLELKTYMLELVNKERARAGVQPVTLGHNNAAQLHAESASKQCAKGHWGIDGLKPYMRYSLAGGYQANGENGSGLGYCFSAAERVRYAPITSMKKEIDETMARWMQSPGHRDNLLRPYWRKVNIGLAWNRVIATMYQHFEGDYVEYDQLPTLTGNTLTFSGRLKNGASFDGKNSFGVSIYYDPPPHPLTPGQLGRTYCVTGGTMVAALRAPLPENWHYDKNSGTQAHDTCVDPYDLPADTPAPRSPTEAHELARAAQARGMTVEQHRYRWITASKMSGKAGRFAVRANLSKVLRVHGPGVYTVLVWAHWGGERIPVSEYSLFHEIERPTHYGTGSP